MNQTGGLPGLGEEHAQTGVSIAFLFARHVEPVLLVAGIRAHPAHVAAKTGRSPDGTQQIQMARALSADNADILKPVEKAAAIAQPFLKALQLRRGVLNGAQQFAAKLPCRSLAAVRRAY